MRCAHCTHPQPEGARFCADCGHLLASPESVSESRKVVSIVFCDLVGSTELSTALDPEALRALTFAYYEAMRDCVERHGGTIEKYIGDAVVAVFGVPSVHEDDALRAARAAVEMRQAAADLTTSQVRPKLSQALAVRIGISTGEVIATNNPSAASLVSGETVNMAARLEQHAGVGEILLSEGTHAAIRDFVLTESRTPLSVKGFDHPLGAWRLLDVLAMRKRHDTPLLGRELELSLLLDAAHRAERSDSPYLCTVYGDAGVGKTRLAEELAIKLRHEGALVGIGACPPYGAGDTLAPIFDALDGLTGDDRPSARRDARPMDEHFLEVRRVIGGVCSGGLMVLTLDDLHWAHADLLQFISKLSSRRLDAKLLVLCMTRFDLLEQAPHWAGGHTNSTCMTLSPLSAAASTDLALSLIGGRPDAERISEYCSAASGGNPFVLEQFLSAQVERPDITTVPHSVHSLIAARLDRLELLDRTALEWAAILGMRFDADDVAVLCEPACDTDRALRNLENRRLIVEDDPYMRTFRFAGLQIREVCYASIPKEKRAKRHLLAAEHLEGSPGREEVTGGHLECAYLLGRELGPGDDSDLIRLRATASLARAGMLALEAEDLAKARSYLTRALALSKPQDGPASLLTKALLIDTARALGGAEQTRALAEQLVAEARAFGAENYAYHGLMELAATREELEVLAPEAITAFEAAEDHKGLTRIWLRRAQYSNDDQRYEQAAAQFETALNYAEQAGHTGDLPTIVGGLALALASGTLPVDQAAARCLQLCEKYGTGRQTVEVAVGGPLAALLAAQGRCAEARGILDRAAEIVTELGYAEPAAMFPAFQAEVEMQCGDLRRAEELARTSIDRFAALGIEADRASSRLLMRILLDAGRADEASALAMPLSDIEALADVGAHGDVSAKSVEQRATVLSLHGRLMAARGELDIASVLGELAGAVACETESLESRATVYYDRALIALKCNRLAEAESLSIESERLFLSKGHHVGAERARTLRMGVRDQ